jgi:hypothetical protein
MDALLDRVIKRATIIRRHVDHLQICILALLIQEDIKQEHSRAVSNKPVEKCQS